MPRSIAVHIGAHKTASTHLQKTLHTNKALLSEDDIRFFGPNYLRRKGRSLEAMFNLSFSNSPAPRRKPHDQLAFLAKGHNRLVFSEENIAGRLTDTQGRMSFPLYPDAPARIAELVAAFAPIQPQIFLAVRNPAAYMTSVYSQTLFGVPNIGPRTFRMLNDWRNVDWAEYVTRLRAIPNVGEIVVWRQEAYAQNQRPILRKLLRWRTGPRVDVLENRVHRGLSRAAVRTTLELAAAGETGSLASDARRAFPVNDENQPFKLYATPTFAQAEAVYAAQIAQIQAMDGVIVL